MPFSSIDWFNRGHPSRLRKNLRIGVAEGVLATPYVFLYVGGNLVLAALLTQVFQVSKGMYGLIVALPALCNAIQILAIPFLARMMDAKRMALGFSWAYLVVWVAMALALPFIPVDNPAQAAWWFLIFLGVNSLFQAIAGVAWTSWVQEWVPQRLRGKYFGRRNRWISLATILFLLASAKWIEWVGSGVTGYQTLFLLVAVLRFFSIAWQHRIVSPANDQDKLAHVGWWGQLGRLGRDRNFVRLVLFGAAVSFLLNTNAPYGAVYLYEFIQLSVFQVSILVIVASLAGAFALPLWGQLADRYGCKTIILLGLFLWGGISLWWPFLHVAFTWPLYVMWGLGGLGMAGFGLGWFNLILKVIPPQAKIAGISLNTALVSIAAAIGPVLMGMFLQMADRVEWISVRSTYLIAFTAVPVAVMMSVVLLRRVDEPEADGMNAVFGAMRTARQIMVLQGLAFLANVTPFRQRRRGK